MRKLRFLAAVLAMVFAVSMIASCGGSQSGSPSQPGAAGTSSAPAKITWINRLNSNFIVEGNPIIAELGRLTNTVIELEAPPINNYDDRRNVVMASGDIPDIVYGGTGSLYEQWAAEGLIMRLDDLLSRMPNVRGDLSDLELQTARIPVMDYALYSLPRIQTKASDCIGYRGDWLEALGMKVPVTPKQFAEVAYAMSHNDPDGNGEKDTYGFSFQIETLNHRYTASAFFEPEAVPMADGSYLNVEAKPGYIEYMDWLAGMYADGSMDPEWFLNDRYGEADKFAAGKVGIRALDTTTAHTMDMFTSVALLEAFPTYQHLPGVTLRGENQTISNCYWAPPVWGNWYISAKTANLDAVLNLIDFGFSDAGHILLNIGIEGEHYNSIDLDLMFVDRTQEQREAAGNYASSYLTFRHRSPGDKVWASGNTLEQVAEHTRREKDNHAQMIIVDYVAGEGITPGINAANLANADLNTERNTMITKYICGEITRAEFVNFLDTKYNPAQADKIAAITAAQPNRAVLDMGLTRR